MDAGNSPSFIKVKCGLALLMLLLLIPWNQLGAGVGEVAGTEVLVLTESTEHIRLKDSMTVMKDDSGTLGIDEVIQAPLKWEFMPNKTGELNEGYTSAVYWVRIAVENTASHESWLLEVAAPSLDHVTLFVPDGIGGFRQTDVKQSLPMDERPYFHRNIVFPLDLSSGSEEVLYIRAATNGAMQLPLHMWEERAFEEKTRMTTALIGLLSGITVIFICYLLFQAYITRQSNYFYLALTTIFLFLAVTSMSGLTFAYIWGDLPYWNQHAILFFIGMSGISFILFAVGSLKLNRHLPEIVPFMYTLAILQIVLLTVLFFSFQTVRFFVPLLLVASAALILLAALSLERKHVAPARQFSAGILLFLIGISVTFLIMIGSVPYINPLRYTSFLLIFAGVFMFFLALRRTAKQQDQEKESLKQMANYKDELAGSLIAAGNGDSVSERTEIEELNISQLAEKLAAKRQSFSLLVIGTAETNRNSIIRQLSEMPYEASGASSGSEALMILSNEEIDLVVIESDLPDIGTIELCERIRREHSMTEMPILLLSEREELAVKQAAFAAGVNDYLVTPCEKEEFLMRVSTLINLRGLTEEIVKMNRSLEKSMQERSMALEVSNRHLTDLADEIQQTERKRNEMLSVISHELNTPITLIHQYIQAVQENLIDERNPHYLDMIHNKLMLLERLTEDLTDLAKYRTDKITLRFQQVEAKGWIERLADSLEQDAINSGRTFERQQPFELEEAGMYQLAVDMDRLDQVFSNILWNAIKHTESEEGKIRLSVSVLETEKEDSEEHADAEMRICVKDSGNGIDPAVLPFIFDRFYKAESAEEKKGSGLGLAIAKEIAEKHKGKIWAESEPGKGSSFYVVLPLTRN